MFKTLRTRWHAARLFNEDLSVVRKAAEHLTAIGGDQAVEALMRLLSLKPTSDNQRWPLSTRKAIAVEALGKIGTPHAFPVLREALSDAELAPSAAQALGNLRDQGSVPHLVHALGQGMPYYGHGASDIIWAIGNLGDRRAIPVLTRALADPSGRTRRQAAKALSKLGDPQWEQFILGDDRDFVRLAQGNKERAFDIAFEVFQRFRGKADVTCAVAALGRLRDRRALDQLVTALQSPSYHSHRERIATIQALGSIADPRAIPVLSGLVGSKCRGQDMPCPQTRRDPFGMGEEADFVCAMCNAGAAALGHFADSSVIRLLSEQAAHNNIGALEGLAHAHAIVAASELPVAAELDNFCRAPLETAFDRLVAVLHDDREFRRCWVAIALGHLKDRRAVQPLVDFIKDGLKRVDREHVHTLDIERAIEALAEIGDPSPIEVLVAVAQGKFTYAEPSVRAIASLLRATGHAIPKDTLHGLVALGDVDKAVWTSDIADGWVYPAHEKMDLSAVRHAAEELLVLRNGPRELNKK
jgi:HEAT repeat protein